MNTKDPRAALNALIAALERHYDAAASSDDDDRLDAATDQLSQAFETYDDALFEKYDIATPFVVFDDDDDEYDDLDDDFDDFDDLDNDDIDGADVDDE